MFNLFVKEYEQLTSTEKFIIDYIHKFPKAFYLNNIETIAADSYVSTASISRLYSKLGFDSLKEMQFYVYHNLILHETSNKSLNEKNLLNSVFCYYYYSIAEFKRNFKHEYFLKKIPNLTDVKEIYLFGMGSSKFTVKRFHQNLQMINFKSFQSDDFHVFLELINNIRKKCLVILFSRSGNSKEFKFLLEYCINQKINYLIITANKFLIQKYQHLIWYDDSLSGDTNIKFLTKVSQSFIVDLLFLYIKDRVKNGSNLSSELLEKWNKK